MVNLTDKNMREILNKPVVFVDFWASWCGPCMALAPIYQAVSEEFEGKAEFVKCNVDENQDIAIKYGINSIPTILVFENGQLTDKRVGLLNENMLVNFVQKHIK